MTLLNLFQTLLKEIRLTICFRAHILIAFENTIRLSVGSLIASAHALIVFGNPIRLSAHPLIASTHALIAFGKAIRLSVHALIASAHPLIAFENTIRLSVSSLIASAHALIVFGNPIRLSAPPPYCVHSRCDVACSPTVPGGDTPCLTAGDAQRANPWIGDAQPSDAGSVAQHPLSSSQDFIFSLSHRYVVTL